MLERMFAVMIGDNIRKFRKLKGMSQEEMAVKLHVVRQTVSKWENSLSVPDAEIVIEIAGLLEVPVSKLLGIEVKKNEIDDLTGELERLNAVLAEKNQREVLVKRAGKARGLILLLTFVAMMIILQVGNPVVSVIMSGMCILATVLTLYRNLALLTSVTTDDLKLPVLRFTTIVNMIIFVIGVIMSVLVATDTLHITEHEESMFAMFLVACVMVFAGIISPKLPFTRHTGLRLPWTVQDKETWNVAHKVTGTISLPLALLYIACALTMECFETITLITMILWIGIPGVISFVYYWKKVYGKM